MRLKPEDGRHWKGGEESEPAGAGGSWTLGASGRCPATLCSGNRHLILPTPEGARKPWRGHRDSNRSSLCQEQDSREAESSPAPADDPSHVPASAQDTGLVPPWPWERQRWPPHCPTFPLRLWVSTASQQFLEATIMTSSESFSRGKGICQRGASPGVLSRPPGAAATAENLPEIQTLDPFPPQPSCNRNSEGEAQRSVF